MKTLTIILASLILCACGGGRDDDLDARKDTPPPKCHDHRCK